MRLRLFSRLPALLVTLAIASCGYIPRTVAGLPPGEPWGALPLRNWLAEDRGEPLALSFCAPPECRPGLAVAVVRLTGEDARITEALLKDPQRLARALRSPAGREKPVRTRIAVDPQKAGPYPGFIISLGPADGGKPPVYGAAFGRRTGEDLTIVLVVGETLDAVEARARQVAARELGS